MLMGSWNGTIPGTALRDVIHYAVAAGSERGSSWQLLRELEHTSCHIRSVPDVVNHTK